MPLPQDIIPQDAAWAPAQVRWSYCSIGMQCKQYRQIKQSGASPSGLHPPGCSHGPCSSQVVKLHYRHAVCAAQANGSPVVTLQYRPALQVWQAAQAVPEVQTCSTGFQCKQYRQYMRYMLVLCHVECMAPLFKLQPDWTWLTAGFLLQQSSKGLAYRQAS